MLKFAALLFVVCSSTLMSAQTAATAAKPKAIPTTQTPATATVKPATAPKAANAGTATQKEAPGGGAGKVWVNTESNVYHCPGTRYYGKTKAGKYMTETQAKAAGAKVAKGQNCSK